MSTTPSYERMNVKELRKELQKLGKSTTGNKSVLLHRLYTGADSVEVQNTDNDLYIDPQMNEINTSSISKEQHTQAVEGNVVYDWTLQVLRCAKHHEEPHIPKDVRLMTENHPDIPIIYRLLLVIGTADLDAKQKPSPSFTIERLKTIIAQEIPYVKVICASTARLLNKFDVDVSIVNEDCLMENPLMDATLDSVQQALMSWTLSTTQTQDQENGMTFPDSFSSDERIAIRKWARSWIKDQNVDTAAPSEEDAKAAATDPAIPNARIRDATRCVLTILRQICAEIRRDVKALEGRKANREAKAGRVVGNEGTAKRRRIRNVIEESDDE